MRSQWTIWTSANAYLRHPARITFRLERSLSPRLTHVRHGVLLMRSSPLFAENSKINNKISKSQLRVRLKRYWTVLGDRVGALESGSRYT